MAIKTGRQPRAPAITLPSPGPQYNRENEAQTRRLIEQLFIRFGESRPGDDSGTDSHVRTRIVADVVGVSDTADQFTGEIALGKSELLFQFDANFPMRARFYESEAARTADLARDIDTDPDHSACALEIIMPVDEVVEAVEDADLEALVVPLRSVDGSGAPLLAANRDSVDVPDNVLYWTVDTFDLDSGEVDILLAAVAPGFGPADFTYHNPCDAPIPYGSCPGTPPMNLSDDLEWTYSGAADSNQTIDGDLYIGRQNAIMSPIARSIAPPAAMPEGYSVTEAEVDLFRLSQDGAVDKINLILGNGSNLVDPEVLGLHLLFDRVDAGKINVSVSVGGAISALAVSDDITLALSSGIKVRVRISPDEGEITFYTGTFLGSSASTLVNTVTGLTIPTFGKHPHIQGSRSTSATGLGLKQLVVYYRRLADEDLAGQFALLTMPIEGDVD